MTGVCPRRLDGQTVYRASIQIKGAFIHLVEAPEKVRAEYAYYSAWRMATGDKKKGFDGNLSAQEKTDIDLSVRERLLTARYPAPKRGARRKDLLILQFNISRGQKWHAMNAAAGRSLGMHLTVDTIIEPNEFNPWRVVFFEGGGVLFGHELLKRYRAERSRATRDMSEVFACRVCGKAGGREEFLSHGVVTKTCRKCREERTEQAVEKSASMFCVGSVWSWKRDQRTRCTVTGVKRFNRSMSICFDGNTTIPASRAIKEMVKANVLPANARHRVRQAVSEKMEQVRVGQVWEDEKGREREVTDVSSNGHSPFVAVRFGNMKTTATRVVSRMRLVQDVPNPTKGEPGNGQEAEEGRQTGHEEAQMLMA